ncbi:MAG: AraC family transcriptional regulator, partial [Clostridiales bacterium]|nr:AraC family transcriptional regulator [Clostridiales bacterium]
NYYYPDMSLDFLARNLAISKNYLCKIFHDSTGTTPIEYLIELRMEDARKRLTQSDDSVSDIAKAVGYRDPLYFSKEFRKKYGKSPVQYRKEFKE